MHVVPAPAQVLHTTAVGTERLDRVVMGPKLRSRHERTRTHQPATGLDTADMSTTVRTARLAQTPRDSPTTQAPDAQVAGLGCKPTQPNKPRQGLSDLAAAPGRRAP